MAKGEYHMVGRTVIITVTEKHWLLPWPVVEVQLRELVQKSCTARPPKRLRTSSVRPGRGTRRDGSSCAPPYVVFGYRRPSRIEG